MQIRPTTVVSQPPRFVTAAVSARLSRSHASWTASSASADRAEHPVGDGLQVRPLLLELLCVEVWVGHPIGLSSRHDGSSRLANVTRSRLRRAIRIPSDDPKHRGER